MLSSQIGAEKIHENKKQRSDFFAIYDSTDGRKILSFEKTKYFVYKNGKSALIELVAWKTQRFEEFWRLEWFFFVFKLRETFQLMIHNQPSTLFVLGINDTLKRGSWKRKNCLRSRTQCFIYILMKCDLFRSIVFSKKKKTKMFFFSFDSSSLSYLLHKRTCFRYFIECHSILSVNIWLLLPLL